DSLPSSLDAQIALFSHKAGGSSQKTEDLTLMPNKKHEIACLPDLSPLADGLVTLSFGSQNNVPMNLLLRGETGKSYQCRSGQTVAVEPGQYLVLYELNGLRGIYRNNSINQRTVFVGSALPSDQDFVVTPINFLDTSFTRMPGVNLHANLFSALIQESFLRALPFHADRAPEL
ncbi:MAG: CHASE2 domain-containing protein, partial [Candidatus Riflebacteria bacterium]|nr:CHASE2 domain-containing protein [Candidatus Riflebacteria bacterium]